ncbi:hypothetical protein IAQ61_002117 [Plenodomus lingam]|uniref:uncharacterized protein n=1 Tax=Leptosphaeria maculans TaxID=5022 RepID=UPI003321EF21|nr:hypothetical protein IAQ61_002117 [Plenodomus lingam]
MRARSRRRKGLSIGVGGDRAEAGVGSATTVVCLMHTTTSPGLLTVFRLSDGHEQMQSMHLPSLQLDSQAGGGCGMASKGGRAQLREAGVGRTAASRTPGPLSSSKAFVPPSHQAVEYFKEPCQTLQTPDCYKTMPKRRVEGPHSES